MMDKSYKLKNTSLEERLQHKCIRESPLDSHDIKIIFK